jgi:hypothetical protein
MADRSAFPGCRQARSAGGGLSYYTTTSAVSLGRRQKRVRYSWLDVVMFVVAVALLIPLVMRFAEIIIETFRVAF